MACFEALRLLDAFTRAGAKTFDLTVTALNGEKVSFRRQLTFNRLRQMMPTLLERAAIDQHNVIVRPQCSNSVPVLDRPCRPALNTSASLWQCRVRLIPRY
jgi:hypothetical protein